MNDKPDLADTLSGILSRNWWVLLLLGLLAIMFGLLALLSPLGAAAMLTLWLGVLAIAEGVVVLAGAIRGSAPVSRGWAVFYALVSLAFGIMATLDPLNMAGTLLLLVAVWLAISGIYRIVFAIRVRKRARHEWLLILSGLLAVLMGVLFALYPLSGLVVTTLWIGASALIYGVLQVVAAFRLRRLGKA